MTNNIATAINEIRASLPDAVQLVAVSKYHPVDAIRHAYDAGQRIFGESRATELVEKIPQLPSDTQWHFIGHLQTNKARLVVGKADLIESVDSQRLLDLIDNLALQNNCVQRVLLQVHVAAEETKYGWTPQELLEYFKQRRFENLKATHLCGLMAMATNTDDAERINRDFRQVADLRRQIIDIAPDLKGFDTLSMGMSDDYPIAIKNGATLIRIGSRIFGRRQTK